MSAFFNLGSLILGLIAWLLPVCAIGKKYRFALCCIGSISCCAVSLLFQLLEVKNRVGLEDWSALMDTIHAVVLAAFVMLAVTLLSNLVALFCPAKR